MKIYKYKDLRDKSFHHHLFQIIDGNKVWCAAPESLNDEHEFSFKIDYKPSEDTATLLMKMLEKLGKSRFPPDMTASFAILNNKLEEYMQPLIGYIVRQCRKSIGVTSFSAEKSGSWLWKKYGGEGNGVVVEFELSDQSLGHTFHPVEYVSTRVFHIDVFLNSQIGDSSQIFRNILCTKTKRWEKEKEIRFLGKTPNVNITFEAPVTGLKIGNNVPDSLAEKLTNHCKSRDLKVNYQKQKQAKNE